MDNYLHSLFITKWGMKLLIHSQTSTGQPVKLKNVWVISPHTLLIIWSCIHGGIKINPCNLNVPNLWFHEDVMTCKWCPNYRSFARGINATSYQFYLGWISTNYDQLWEIIWVRSQNCGCLVTWFCYQLIAKPGNKTAVVSWPDPCEK